MRKALITSLILLISLITYACGGNEVPTEPIETIPTVVQDTTAPMINGANDITITIGDSFNPATGVTATDNVDGNISHLIVITGTYNVGVAGIYEIIYTVSDSAGNQTVINRKLTVNLQPIDQAILNMNQADSYTMSILFKSGSESYVMLVEISQAFMRVDVLDEVVYYEVDGETCYIYEMEQMTWQKNVVNCSEKGTTELQFLSNFSSDYFVEQMIDEVKTYVLKMEHYSSLQLFLGSTITSNFRMTLSNDHINQILFTMTRNSIVFDMTITFSKFNQTTVTLPEVTVS
jgi:hypothetical protein